MGSMNDSNYMEKAKGLLSDARGKPMSLEERREAAIELAALMLGEARRIQTHGERASQGEIADMIRDPNGKAFTICLTDQCFRSGNDARVADQMVYLLNKFGIPDFLSFEKRWGLRVFRALGSGSRFLVPLVKKLLRRQTRRVILPGERKALNRHIEKREKRGCR